MIHHHLYETAIHLLEKERKAILENRITDANMAAREFKVCYLDFLNGQPPRNFVDELRHRRAENCRLRRSEPA